MQNSKYSNLSTIHKSVLHISSLLSSRLGPTAKKHKHKQLFILRFPIAPFLFDTCCTPERGGELNNDTHTQRRRNEGEEEKKKKNRLPDLTAGITRPSSFVFSFCCQAPAHTHYTGERMCV